MARSNGELVAKARAMAEDAGRRVATVAETRERRAGAAVTGALAGLRVLDLSRLLPGGFCSLLLADMGADVVKVEDTGEGDYLRWAEPRYEGAEPSAGGAMFLALNRGKRSMRIDLKTAQGATCCCGSRATPTCCSSPSGRACSTASGSGWERLREENPRLVVCAITGYGQDGPFAARAGHDIDYLARVGLLGLTGDSGRAAGAGRGPDRRRRRRRADGGVRDPGRAARARPQSGRGPGRRRVDDRRRAVVAGDGRRARPGRRGAARARAAGAGRRAALLPPVPLRRRLGRARRARAEVLARLVRGGRPRGPRRAPVRARRLRRPTPRSRRCSPPATEPRGRRSTPSTTAASSRCSRSRRRSSPSSSARAA